MQSRLHPVRGQGLSHLAYLFSRESSIVSPARLADTGRQRGVMSRHLPSRPNLEHLKKQAKARLAELQQLDPNAQLTDAQHALACEYGFASWLKLKAEVEGARRNLLAGSWIANFARSAPNPMNPLERAELRIEMQGDVVTIVDTSTDESGRVEKREHTIRADALEHASEGGRGYSLTAAWNDAHALETVARKDGREVGRITYAISPDGQTLTVSATSQPHNGYPATEHRMVFDRR